MKPTILAFFFLRLLLVVCSSSAEVAVRHSSVSENEFQALAQALGYTPVAEMTAQQSNLPSEVSELFRSRLFDAQKEWLTRRESLGSRTATPSAIDLFLELRLSADWHASERHAFITFLIRKLEAPDGRDDAFRDLAAFLFHEDGEDLSEMNSTLRPLWNTWRLTNEKTWVSFPSSLPSDVTAVSINGQLFPRSSAMTLKFPRSPVRVTFLSNSLQPISLNLNGSEIDWPIVERRAWVQDDCSIAKAPEGLAEMKFKVLGFSKCEGVLTTSHPTTTSDRAQIENFGLAKSASEPIDLPALPAPSIVTKPLFWGAVGAVILGAVVVSQLRDRSSAGAITPTNSEGW